jgi:hypothetical protein
LNPELAIRVDPGHTAILSMEMQRGIVGDVARVMGPAVAGREGGIVGRCGSL